jgi:hypothetical protein
MTDDGRLKLLYGPYAAPPVQYGGVVNLGRPQSEETRRKRSETHKWRGTRPPAADEPWAPDEDELARTLPAADVARRTVGRWPRCITGGLSWAFRTAGGGSRAGADGGTWMAAT